jgi:hypothetical protein
MEDLALEEIGWRLYGDVSDVQRAQIVTAQATAKPFCTDEAATAAQLAGEPLCVQV